MPSPTATTDTTDTTKDAVLVNPGERCQHIRTFFAAVGRQEIEIYNEFIVEDIDDIVRKVRFDGWQATLRESAWFRKSCAVRY